MSFKFQVSSFKPALVATLATLVFAQDPELESALRAERARIAPYLGAEPDKTLALVAEMDLGGPELPAGAAVAYVCPMHPDVTSSASGRWVKLTFLATTYRVQAETDGDGVADETKVLFTGFGATQEKLNVQGLINHFIWGLDNRIHGCSGLVGGMVKQTMRPHVPPIDVRGKGIVIDPRDWSMRTEAAGGQYGLSFGHTGRLWTCSNSVHIETFMYDISYARRNPFAMLPDPRITPCPLPDEVAAWCIQAARTLELLWTGIDLRRTPDGRGVIHSRGNELHYLGVGFVGGLVHNRNAVLGAEHRGGDRFAGRRVGGLLRPVEAVPDIALDVVGPRLEVQDQIDLSLASARCQDDIAHLEGLQVQAGVLFEREVRGSVVVVGDRDTVLLQLLPQRFVGLETVLLWDRVFLTVPRLFLDRIPDCIAAVLRSPVGVVHTTRTRAVRRRARARAAAYKRGRLAA